MVTVYNARGMTGRVKADVVADAKRDKAVLEAAGITVLCPVEKENVKPTEEKLLSSKKAMLQHWPEDKRMIREANLVFDFSPHMNSEGCKHEIGYARYFLYKPIVRIFPKGQLPVASSVAYFEDDFICDSIEAAIEYAKQVHGTRQKRIKWRFELYTRCLQNMVICWITSWK